VSKEDPKKESLHAKPREGSNHIDWSIGKRCFYLNKEWWVVVKQKCPTCGSRSVVLRRKEDWLKDHRGG